VPDSRPPSFDVCAKTRSAAAPYISGAASERIASLISSRRISLPRKGCRVDLRIVLFEAYSAFARVAACTLALSPIRDTLIEGFSHFVTSMSAPMLPAGAVAGWGLHPLESAAFPRRTPRTDIGQRERFHSQRRTHRISRFYWQRRYGMFIEVPNSYRTWIKASAGASNTSRDTFALQSISPTSREVAATFLPHLALGMQDYFSGDPIARSETPLAFRTQADRL
jgi:hypothetical protein